MGADLKTAKLAQKTKIKITADILCRIAVATAILVVLSQIVFPLPSGIPVTLQTFGVAFLGYLLGWVGLVSVIVYLGIGAVGVPVFAALKGGIASLLGLTGGFLWGFVPFVLFCGLAKQQKKLIGLLLGLLGLLVCHLVGVLQYCNLGDVSFFAGATVVSLPYLLKDILSLVAACFLAQSVKKALVRSGINGNYNYFKTKGIMDKKTSITSNDLIFTDNSSKDKICYVFGAAPTTQTKIDKHPQDLVIAADGGYNMAKLCGVTPDIFVGDCDSCESLPNDVKTVQKLNPIKDYTDMQSAVQIGIQNGYTNFVLYGGVGGQRADHTFANIQLLYDMANKNLKVKMVGQNQIFTVVKNGEITFDSEYKGFVSVFSLTPKSYGVEETGLKYALKDATLSFDTPLGVSNEFCGCCSKISLKEGILLVIYAQKPKKTTI